MIFQNLSKNGEMLKNVGENIKKNFAVIFFYTIDIKNTIFNPKFYQHFLPSLLIIYLSCVVLNGTYKCRSKNCAFCALRSLYGDLNSISKPYATHSHYCTQINTNFFKVCNSFAALKRALLERGS